MKAFPKLPQARRTRWRPASRVVSQIHKLRVLMAHSGVPKLAPLFAVVLAMALFEALAIASVLPFMQLVARPEMLQSNALLGWIHAAVGFVSERELLVGMGAAVLFLVALSTAISAYTTWFISNTVWKMAHRLTMRLVENYVAMPYQQYLTHNTASFLRKVISDVSEMVTGVLLAGIHMIAYGVLSLVIVLVILAVEPVVALLVFLLFGGSYALIHLAQHRYMTRLGSDRIDAVDLRLRTFSETLMGIKTLRTEGVSHYFVQRFEIASKRLARIHPRYELVMKLPRFAVEFLAVMSVVVTILYLLIAKQDFLSAIPILGLFAMASFRLLPALHQASYGAMQVSHYLPVVEEVYQDMGIDLAREASEAPQAAPVPFEDCIRLIRVGFSYQGVIRSTLTDIDLTIPKHSRIGLVGTTGSGKTTLADLIMGLIPVQEGVLSVDGRAISPKNVAVWRHNVAYVPQEVFLYDETIASNIAFGIEPDRIDEERLHEAARLAQIHDFIVNDLPEGYRSPVGERGTRLSGGQRQRVGLARAFYRRPQLLVLDESTSALDGITEDALFSTLDRELPGLTILTIAHRLSTVRACDRIYLLEDGRIAAEGSFDDLYESNSQFRRMVELSGATLSNG